MSEGIQCHNKFPDGATASLFIAHGFLTNSLCRIFMTLHSINTWGQCHNKSCHLNHELHAISKEYMDGFFCRYNNNLLFV